MEKMRECDRMGGEKSGEKNDWTQAKNSKSYADFSGETANSVSKKSFALYADT